MDAADHESQPRPLGMGGHEAEGRHPLQHGGFRRPAAADLEEVVHHPDRVEPGLVGRLHDASQGWTDGGSAAGPGERVDLQPELHVAGCSTATPFQKAT